MKAWEAPSAAFQKEGHLFQLFCADGFLDKGVVVTLAGRQKQKMVGDQGLMTLQMDFRFDNRPLSQVPLTSAAKSPAPSKPVEPARLASSQPPVPDLAGRIPLASTNKGLMTPGGLRLLISQTAPLLTGWTRSSRWRLRPCRGGGPGLAGSP